jgi:DNA-binding transcriptional MerR regulator
VLSGGGSIRAVDKSPDAFRTISEVADDLDLPQHVLRFWETRFAQIKPLKRGGGRRYYRPDDVELLKGIRHLLYGQGYTIRGVQRILKSDGVRFVQSIGRGELKVAAAPPEPPGEADPAFLDEIGEQAEPEFEEAAHPAPPAVIPGSAEVASHREPSAAELAGGHLTPQQAASLMAALDELLECQRVLATLTDVSLGTEPDRAG